MNVRDSHVAHFVPPNIRRTIEQTDAKILVMPQGNISSHTNKFRERERSFRNAFGKKWTAIARAQKKKQYQQQQRQTAIATNCENKRGLPSSDGEMATNLGGALRHNSFHRNGQANDRAPSDDNGVVVDAGSGSVTRSTVFGIRYSINALFLDLVHCTPASF